MHLCSSETCRFPTVYRTLTAYAPAATSGLTALANDGVARNHEYDRIGGDCLPDGPSRLQPPDPSRELYLRLEMSKLWKKQKILNSLNRRRRWHKN